MASKSPKCALCGVRRCLTLDKEIKLPSSCPTENYSDIVEEAIDEYLNNPHVKETNEAWAEVSKRMKPNRFAWTRVDEVIEFAKIRGLKKLGIATCFALLWESRLLTKILEKHGFDVVSVSCLTGEIAPAEAGIERDGVFCNPIMQAEVLNREGTDLNIMMGLCVGHDILFNRYSKADVTPLVVKDRSTGNNPVAALYQSAGYYAARFEPKKK